MDDVIRAMSGMIEAIKAGAKSEVFEGAIRLPSRLATQPVLGQSTNACGPASIVMVLHSHGLTTLPAKTEMLQYTSMLPNGGTDLRKMLYLMNKYGSSILKNIMALGHGSNSIDKLRAATDAGKHIIAVIKPKNSRNNVFHAIVVDGFVKSSNTEFVIIRDPANAESWMVPIKEFADRWDAGGKWSIYYDVIK